MFFLHFQLAEEGYSLIYNCAGIDGAKLAGDDNQMQPNRGIAIEVQLVFKF